MLNLPDSQRLHSLVTATHTPFHPDGSLNLINPACLVFPDENQCQPWDAFKAAQREEAVERAGREAEAQEFVEACPQGGEALGQADGHAGAPSTRRQLSSNRTLPTRTATSSLASPLVGAGPSCGSRTTA